jgi:hypothetical protein
VPVAAPAELDRTVDLRVGLGELGHPVRRARDRAEGITLPLAPRPAATTTTTPATGRRAGTVYQRPRCDTGYLGRQWCHDCRAPAPRLDLSGLCPHCDEPAAINDVIEQSRYSQPSQAVNPPSALMTPPVRYDASGPARKDTTPAASSARP